MKEKYWVFNEFLNKHLQKSFEMLAFEFVEVLMLVEFDVVYN